MNNANKPMFPTQYTYGDYDGLGAPVIVDGFSMGLTKREYFAAMAMQGLLANPEVIKGGYDISKDAIFHANDLLQALDNKEEQK